VRALIESGRVDTVHDISDGGLLVAISEMAIAGNIGAKISSGGIPFLFGEDQARYCAGRVARSRRTYYFRSQTR